MSGDGVRSLCKTRIPIRIPGLDDLAAYRGAHTAKKWSQLSLEWECPSCRRSKFQQLRWTKSITGYGVPKGEYQWLAPIHDHHDHGADSGSRNARFPNTMLCFDCNNADGRAKRLLALPEDFSFSPSELEQFVTGIPHCGVDIDLVRADLIAREYLSRGAQTFKNKNATARFGVSPMTKEVELSVSEDFLTRLEGKKFGTILADPPWQFQNRTGKIAPEHKRLARYGTMDLKQIKELPVCLG